MHPMAETRRSLVTRAAPLLAGLIAIAAAGSVARGQTPSDVEQATKIVMRQLEAFRQDDYDTAYGFASAMIRERFDRPAFEAMVRGGYPEIARSVAAVVVGSQAAPDDSLALLLKIRDASGRSVEAVYEMVREGDAWRINGVATRPDESSI
jgi:uncharacterized protein DUF4864